MTLLELKHRMKRENVWTAISGGIKFHTGHSSSVGVPSALNIVLSWSISLSPGK